jgi:glycosyltransferase involved in cell wall biosynthesis
LAVPADSSVISNIAFDAPFKGVDTLIRALPRIVHECPNLYLMQVGIDPSVSALPTLASELGVAEHVRWMGIRDHAASLLLGTDLYVQPSKFGEGLPLAIMEAMAIGLPCVVTRVAGNTEAVVDGVTGLVVEPDDPNAIAEGVITMVNSRELWPRFSAEASAHFEVNFNGHASAARLVEEHYGIPRHVRDVNARRRS